VFAVVACLSGPIAYSAQTITTAHTGSIPSAGPGASIGAGGPGGAMGSYSTSSITSWVQLHFKSVKIGGQTVYDLTQGDA
jgi:hypothetical protein